MQIVRCHCFSRGHFDWLTPDMLRMRGREGAASACCRWYATVRHRLADRGVAACKAIGCAAAARFYWLAEPAHREDRSWTT